MVLSACGEDETQTVTFICELFPLLHVVRFTVASRTAEGDSAESDPSAAVRPNQPLPQGWTEKFTAMTGKVRKVVHAHNLGAVTTLK